MTEAKPRFRVPHTLVLIFGMVVLAYIATFILPKGQFETFENDHGKQQVVADSYHEVDGQSLPWWTIFAAIPKGFEEAGDIIFFVFIVGGAFGVLRATGATDAGIGALIRSLGDYPALLLFGSMFAFAIGSYSIGMAEEYLPFVPILLSLCIALGFDAVTAIGVLTVGYGVGYGAAAFNPFTVMIGQEVSGLDPTSGAGFRTILFFIFLAVGFHHVWSYAKKVKAAPEKSLVVDQEIPIELSDHDVKFTTSHALVLAVTALAIGILVWGIKVHEWYMIEMGAAFMILTVLLAAVARISPDKTAVSFCRGSTELTTTALLIGFARAIKVVLDDGMIIDTVINGIAQPLKSLGPHLAAVGMFFVQSAINFFIPSGSGQAYVTMPIMAPLADLVGVSRQVAVLAYQFGDGFTNIMIPTNAVLIGILTMAGIPFERWLKFILPFMLKIWILGSIALAVAVTIGYS